MTIKQILLSTIAFGGFIHAADIGDLGDIDDDRFSQVSGGGGSAISGIHLEGEEWGGLGELPSFGSSVPLKKLCSAFEKIVIGQKKDRIAYKTIEKAAKADHLVAKALLGHVLMYETPFQEKQRGEKLIEECLEDLIEKREEGDKGAQLSLGLMYLWGHGTDRDEEEARELLEPLAKEGVVFVEKLLQRQALSGGGRGSYPHHSIVTEEETKESDALAPEVDGIQEKALIMTCLRELHTLSPEDKSVKAIYVHIKGADKEWIKLLASRLPDSLEALTIGGNDLGAAGVAILSQAFPSRLNYLNFCRNKIGAAGVMALVSAVPQTLETLYLGGGDFGVQGEEALSFLQESLSTLTLHRTAPFPFNHKDPRLYEATPLYLAAHRLELDKCKELIMRGAKVNKRIKKAGPLEDTTPLWAAISRYYFMSLETVNKKKAVCDLLLLNGADLNVAPRSTPHQTALWETITYADYELASLLIRYGALLSLSPSDWRRMLFHLIQETREERRGFREWFSLLKFSREDVETVDASGATSLHIAARWNNIEACEVLLDMGLSPFLKDRAGRSALDYAQRRETKELLQEGMGRYERK